MFKYICMDSNKWIVRNCVHSMIVCRTWIWGYIHTYTLLSHRLMTREREREKILCVTRSAKHCVIHHTNVRMPWVNNERKNVMGKKDSEAICTGRKECDWLREQEWNESCYYYKRNATFGKKQHVWSSLWNHCTDARIQDTFWFSSFHNSTCSKLIKSQSTCSSSLCQLTKRNVGVNEFKNV